MFFADIGEDEAIAVARNRADEARIPWVVIENATNRADRLAERAVGDGDVAPHAIEDVAPMDGLVAVFDEKHQQVEVAGDERLFAAAPQQQPAPGRQDEFVEVITGHGLE